MLWIVESSSNWARAVDTSQHVGLESCESKPGTGWGREAETAASANNGTSPRFQIRHKQPFVMEITWGLIFSWEWQSKEMRWLTWLLSSYTQKSVNVSMRWLSRRRNGCNGNGMGEMNLSFKLDLSYSVSELNIPCWKKIHLGAPGLQ